MATIYDIDRITDWPARLRLLVYEQFKEDPFVLLFCDAYGAQLQQLEDSGQALLTIPSIDLSEGVQLDVIGVIVGQPRQGVPDSTYRLYLRARIRANKSGGTPADLYAVFFAMFGALTILQYVPGGDASFTFRILSSIDPVEAAVALVFLTDSKAAGVRGILEWSPADPGDMFTVSDADDPTAGTGLGFGDANDYTVGGQLAGALGA